jgi:hypothetical protein
MNQRYFAIRMAFESTLQDFLDFITNNKVKLVDNFVNKDGSYTVVVSCRKQTEIGVQIQAFLWSRDINTFTIHVERPLRSQLDRTSISLNKILGLGPR